MKVRVVLDTNVILAGKLAKSPTSPNREILERWVVGEFDLLYSTGHFFLMEKAGEMLWVRLFKDNGSDYQPLNLRLELRNSNHYQRK